MTLIFEDRSGNQLCYLQNDLFNMPVCYIAGDGWYFPTDFQDDYKPVDLEDAQTNMTWISEAEFIKQQSNFNITHQ